MLESYAINSHKIRDDASYMNPNRQLKFNNLDEKCKQCGSGTTNHNINGLHTIKKQMIWMVSFFTIQLSYHINEIFFPYTSQHMSTPIKFQFKQKKIPLMKDPKIF